MLSFSEYCQLMTEGFFGKAVLGDVPIVKTLGIITAENPGDNKLTKVGNERKNKGLEGELEKLGFAPIPMQGKFAGVNERPFLVLNISREKLVELAKKYRQRSVIYAEKKEKRPSFEFVLLQNGRATRKGVLGPDHPKNLLGRDCYFKLSGEKYNIRFNL